MTIFKHPKIKISLYIIFMKTISIFILLIYWSIMIFAPVMSKDPKMDRVKTDEPEITAISKVIR